MATAYLYHRDVTSADIVMMGLMKPTVRKFPYQVKSHTWQRSMLLLGLLVNTFIIPASYDSDLAPPGSDGKAVDVIFSVDIISFDKIVMKDMLMAVELRSVVIKISGKVYEVSVYINS